MTPREMQYSGERAERLAGHRDRGPDVVQPGHVPADVPCPATDPLDACESGRRDVRFSRTAHEDASRPEAARQQLRESQSDPARASRDQVDALVGQFGSLAPVEFRRRHHPDPASPAVVPHLREGLVRACQLSQSHGREVCRRVDRQGDHAQPTVLLGGDTAEAAERVGGKVPVVAHGDARHGETVVDPLTDECRECGVHRVQTALGTGCCDDHDPFRGRAVQGGLPPQACPCRLVPRSDPVGGVVLAVEGCRASHGRGRLPWAGRRREARRRSGRGRTRSRHWSRPRTRRTGRPVPIPGRSTAPWEASRDRRPPGARRR